MSYTPTPLSVLLRLGRSLTGATGFTLSLGAVPVGGADAAITNTALVPVTLATADARLFVAKQFTAPWQAAKGTATDVVANWRSSTPVQRSYVGVWAAGTAQQKEHAAPWSGNLAQSSSAAITWGALDALQKELNCLWGDATDLQSEAAFSWRAQLPTVQLDYDAPWERAQAWAVQSAATWRKLSARELASTLTWNSTHAADTLYALPWNDADIVNVYASRTPTKLLPPPVEPPAPTAAAPRNHACINLGRFVVGQPVKLNLGRPVQLDVCFGSTLIVNNTLQVTTLVDSQPLEVSGISMACDVDSYAWSLDMQLTDYSAYARLLPDNNGPKTVEVTLNGYVWRFLVERISRGRQFNQPQFSASGRSFTAYAAAPYTLPDSGVNNAAALAQQLALGALPMDFALDWQAEDWLVSAGLLRYEDKDALSVAAQVWGAVGAVAVPSRNAKQFTVRPRYPVSPWLWNTAALDAVITEQQQLQTNVQYAAGSGWNKVYVGGTTEGNLVGVRRAGTAGDFVKTQVLDPLLCTAAACLERGRVELAAGGGKAACTVLTPLNAANVAEPRLRTLLQLVEVQDTAAAASWRGLVTGVRVVATRDLNQPLAVAQELQLERYYG